MSEALEAGNDELAPWLAPIASGPPAWDLSCLDWWQRLQTRRTPIPDLPLDRRRADQAVTVFKKLRIPDVPGNPTFGEAAGQHRFDVVAAMFGAYDPGTNIRMIRSYFELIAKKNSKTTDGAAIALTAAIINQRPLAELICTGPSQEVSGKAYNQAKGMIALDREGYLQSRFHVRDHLQTIEDRISGSKLKIKTFDASIVTGGVITFALIDELHEIARISRAAAILQQITGGMVSVPEAFLAMITTQSNEVPSGIFKSNLKVARGIRDGRIKDVDMLPILYEFPEEQQKDRGYWQEPRHWRFVNPNEGRSTFIPTLIKDLAKAREEGEESVRIFFSQHLNVEIGLAMQSDAWAGADDWESRIDRTITLESFIKRCEVVVPGADGGGLDDLLGFVLVGREKETNRLIAWGRAWCHEKVLKLREDIAPRLLDFKNDGDLVIVKKMETAFRELAAIVLKVYQAGLIDRIAVDRFGVRGIVTALLEAGIPEELLEGVHQGFQLSGSIKDTEGMLSDGRLWHAGQPIMAWCVGNAKVNDSGNAISITKQIAGKAKIDLVIALFIAMSRMRLEPTPAEQTMPEDYDVPVWA